MKRELVALMTTLAVVLVPTQAVGQDDFPRTPSGKPDFNGNYDISTLTPFQRPSEYGNRLYLNQEEVQALRDREMNADPVALSSAILTVALRLKVEILVTITISGLTVAVMVLL